MRVVFEDNHLLAVAKPAGVATMGALAGAPSMVERAKEYLRAEYGKGGEVYLGVVSRLDSPVSGVVLFARTSKAAARLTAAFASHRVEKRYLAVVEGEAAERDELVHFLRHDDRNHRVHATHEGASGAQQAKLRYRRLARRNDRSLLEVELLTGRKHQVRVQLAKAGLPIAGDIKYGASSRWGEGIGLHSWRLGLDHPVRHEALVMGVEPPPAWNNAMAKFGVLEAANPLATADTEFRTIVAERFGKPGNGGS
ncbi:MAG: RluA family pseudouridine synthase [Lacipirellulaceae bacterium]